ncbi:MAG: nitroreductase family protein [Chloroflexi bacterium]|nr:nitroreductase family protein [Dehalococcoidia bacterium]MCO5201072.1 nitroreductase family protein [Chloroflexota bacterium]
MTEPAVVVSDFFEVIGTQRAMRRLKPAPVPEAYIKKIIWAATRAPSGGNRQGWRWLVITDPESKQKIQEWYHEGWSKMTASGYGAGANLPEAERLSNERVMKSATYLAEHMHEVPVLILACSLTGNGDITSGSSIYPAVQNLMLAARALGLGTALTTVHRGWQKEIRELFGIPESVETAALIPVGWPKGKFGSGFRKPVEDVTYWEKWGAKKA